MKILWQLLNITLLTMETWQLHALNSIVMAAENKSEILTLVLFGQLYEIEPYMRVLEAKRTPKLVITRSYGDINLNHESGFNREIFFIAVASLEQKELWNLINNAFMGIQGHVRGVFITVKPKMSNSHLNLRQHFDWCWKKGFTNALILINNENNNQQKFQIYNYNHFQQRKLINMTSLNKSELYPDKFRNLHKFKIRTAALFDPPRVFERRNCGARYKNRLMGYVATLFQAFLKEYNADMDLQFATNKNISIRDIMRRIDNDEIDLSINPFIPYKNAHLSYPLRMLQRCVVVPFPEELPKYKFFIMPFQAKVWLSFLATWFIFSLAKLFGWIFNNKKWSQVSVDVGETLLEVWRLMMCLPTYTSCLYRDFKWFNALWFSIIACMGFIFTNLYMASLTSFFSALEFEPMISTLEELIEKGLVVDAVDYEIPTITNNHDLPKGFAELLRARTYFDFVTDIMDLKPNHSYTALEDRIQFALNQQIHLQKPISQMVRECLTTMPLGFIIPAHSQFEKPLNRFILRSSSAGLVDKWILDAIQDGYCSGLLNMRKPKLNDTRPLTLQHFQFGWFVLGGGYLIGFLTFSLENVKRLLNRCKVFIVYY